MMRLGAIFWLILVLAAGFTTFKTKYAIQDLEDELAKVRKQTVAEQSEIRVLTAEWTFLNQPEHLADLNKRFLNLGPVATKQLQQRVEDISLRPVPQAPDKPPAPENMDQLVAAATADTVAPAPVAAAAPVSAPVPMPVPAKVAAAPVAPAPTTASPKPVVAAAVTPVAKVPAPRVQLAKATAPASLDSLIAKIVEVH